MAASRLASSVLDAFTVTSALVMHRFSPGTAARARRSTYPTNRYRVACAMTLEGA